MIKFFNLNQIRKAEPVVGPVGGLLVGPVGGLVDGMLLSIIIPHDEDGSELLIASAFVTEPPFIQHVPPFIPVKEK